MVMISLSDFCRDLFLLAYAGIDASGPIRGWRWEQRVAGYLARRGVPVETLPGGYQLFGHVSLSSLKHQIDGTIDCDDAIVIGEWKAFKGKIPKNELLRFKAATDDYFMALGDQAPKRPVVRIFGGTGEASDSIRSYAYHHGIVLVENGMWPVPTLTADNSFWQRSEVGGPGASDRTHLGWAARPFQKVLAAQTGGAFVFPKPPVKAKIEALMRLHEYWSNELWNQMDYEPGRFESMVEKVMHFSRY